VKKNIKFYSHEKVNMKVFINIVFFLAVFYVILKYLFNITIRFRYEVTEGGGGGEKEKKTASSPPATIKKTRGKKEDDNKTK
jgi:hypothetical protein